MCSCLRMGPRARVSLVSPLCRSVAFTIFNCCSTVYAHICSGHVGVFCDVHDHVRDLVRLGYSGEQVGRCRIVFLHACSRLSRADAVDADRCEFLCECFGEVDECGFARAVGDVLGSWLLCAVAGYVDDATHVGSQCSAEYEWYDYVDFVCFGPVSLARCFGVLAQVDTGVVDEYVEFFVLFDDVFDVFDRAVLCQISFDELDAGFFGKGFCGAFVFVVVHQDVVSTVKECAGDRFADASVSPGDKCVFHPLLYLWPNQATRL